MTSTAQNTVKTAAQANDEAFTLSTLWKKHRVASALTIITSVFIIILFVLAVLSPSRAQYSIWNYKENGSAALANIGSAHGLHFTQVETPNSALSLAKQVDTTVVVMHPEDIPEEVLEKINELPNPVVVFFDSRIGATSLGVDLVPIKRVDSVLPQCDAGVARAGALSAAIYGIKAESGDEACYPNQDGFLWVHRPANEAHGDRYYIADSKRVSNNFLAEGGNASALLSTISAQNSNIIWWLGNDLPLHPTENSQHPPYLTQVLLLLAALFFTAAIVYGRRFGPLVQEDIPVVVPSLETMRGRANLYFRSRDYQHLLNTNRAWVIKTLSAQAGISPISSPEEVSMAIARLTKRNTTEVKKILYDAPANSKQQLKNLLQELQQLESELDHDN